MEEIIKEFLYYSSLICGSLTLISLSIVGTIKLFFMALDHLKMANTLRKAIRLYVQTNRPPVKKARANASVAFKMKENK